MTEKNGHSLNVIPLVTERELNRDDMIGLLEEVKAQAMEGKVSAVGICIVRPDGSINADCSQTDQGGALLGAVAWLQNRVLAALVDDDQ